MVSVASKLIVELVGTFFFVSVILNTLTDNTLGAIGPITVSVALLAAIYFGWKISGANFNPAVSIAMYFKNNLTIELLFGYIIFQIIGASLAVIFSNYVMLK